MTSGSTSTDTAALLGRISALEASLREKDSLLEATRRGDGATASCGGPGDPGEQQSHCQEMTKTIADLVHLADGLRRARDAAEQANRAKTRFLTGISHELRTPLNGILGYAQLLHLDQGLSTTHLAKVEAMMDAGTHLLHMINRVLDLSEIEAEHVEVQRSRIDLYGVAGACLDLVRPSAAAKRLALSLAIAPNVPAHIMSDPTRLRQVLFNLVGNAVKFTDKGTVEVRLRLAADGARLRIEVADTGPGIPAYQKHRLFQEFERLSADTVGPVEGAGLGLVLSARVAALLGGRIGHEDNPDGGSIFWLELPVTASGKALSRQIAPPVPGVPEASSAAPPARELRVLVVDDVAMSRDIAASFLRVAGHQVICAEGGREAVAAIAAADFDIVLMDVRMPEMDGLEATRRVRALEGPRGRVPIVALTAQAFSGQARACRKAGMDGHLVKPLTLASLLDTVGQVATAAPTAEQGANPVSSPTAATTVPTPGSALPVLNAAVFDATAAFFPPDAVATYLRTLIDQGETLRRGLGAPDALARAGGTLAAAAHTIAGSASMFGFERLAAAGRHFEHAVQTGMAEAPLLAEDLGAALDSAVAAMRDRMLVEDLLTSGRTARSNTAATPSHSPLN